MATLIALSPAVDAKPTGLASNLRVLKENTTRTLCYDASVYINDASSASKSKAIETRMGQMLSGLGIKASEFDIADDCDRTLNVTISVDSKPAPTIYSGSMTLYSTLTIDGETDLDLVGIWNDYDYGANVKSISNTAIDQTIQDLTDGLFKQFKEDWAARNND